jgi:hypothetical protein
VRQRTLKAQDRHALYRVFLEATQMSGEKN